MSIIAKQKWVKEQIGPEPMRAENPNGTGSLSLNRNPDSKVGDYSVAEGYQATATGECSFSQGYMTVSNFNSMSTSGRYNVIDTNVYDIIERDVRLEYPEGLATMALSYTKDITKGYVLNNPKTLQTVKNIPEGCYIILDDISISASKKPTSSLTIYYIKEQHGAYRICDRYTAAIPGGQGIGGYAQVVGNGASDDSRSNAYTLDWQGNGWFAGDVYVGSTSGINKDKGSKRLATEEYITSPKTCFVLVDEVTGYNYIVGIRNGNFVSMCKTNKIQITTPPNKMQYAEGETFDPSGMVVTLYRDDGSQSIIENYTYDVRDLNQYNIVISYIEFGITYTTNIQELLLIDFEYTVNNDGTYTITDWKQTLHGDPSTEMIVPDFSWINVEVSN